MSDNLPEQAAAKLRQCQRWAVLAGVVALGICAAAAPFSLQQFFRAYLAAYQFYLGIGLGCFVIVMIYHLTGGAWGFLIVRILEAGMRTLPYLALMFIPIACGAGQLYAWAQPDQVAADKSLQHKQIYLNVPFFCGRAALFFAIWISTAFCLNRWSKKLDETWDRTWAERLSTLSGVGLVVFGITITFGVVDWLMSLQPKFHSTIFGPLIVTGQVLTAQSVALITLAWLTPRSSVAEVVSPKALNDLGNLLFTFLVIWAYMVWFQFMLIWIANLPYEVLWYLPRLRGGWLWVVFFLLLFHFAVPFFLLLMRDLKQHLPSLARVAALLLGMHLVWIYYLVMPAFPDTTLAEHWMDFLMPVGLGGLWLWCFLQELARRPLLPAQSADRVEAEHLRASDGETAPPANTGSSPRPQEA